LKAIPARQNRASERRCTQPLSPRSNRDDFDLDLAHAQRPKVRHLFRLGFIEEKTNVVFLGPAGTGKTHLASASLPRLPARHSVLFTTAVDIVNHLLEAQPPTGSGPRSKNTSAHRSSLSTN